MTLAVVLDSGPLGLLTAPPRRADARACSHWLADLLTARFRIVIPEITDYELRRELLRAGKYTSVQRLDALAQVTEYIPITTAVMGHRRLSGLSYAETTQLGVPRSTACSVGSAHLGQPHSPSCG
jgi:hypothetical protein